MLSSLQFRRVEPRVSIQSLCCEYAANREQHAFVVDLSESGVRLMRPGPALSRENTLLELELPDIDELIWAEGLVCFEETHELATPNELGLCGTVTTSGIRLRRAAKAHQRLLRDYVHFLRNERGLVEDTSWFSYLPGVSNPGLAPGRRHRALAALPLPVKLVCS